MALSGQTSCARVCPLSDHSGQQWILARDGLSANDPQRTLGVAMTFLKRELDLANSLVTIGQVKFDFF